MTLGKPYNTCPQEITGHYTSYLNLNIIGYFLENLLNYATLNFILALALTDEEKAFEIDKWLNRPNDKQKVDRLAVLLLHKTAYPLILQYNSLLRFVQSSLVPLLPQHPNLALISLTHGSENLTADHIRDIVRSTPKAYEYLFAEVPLQALRDKYIQSMLQLHHLYLPWSSAELRGAPRFLQNETVLKSLNLSCLKAIVREHRSTFALVPSTIEYFDYFLFIDQSNKITEIFLSLKRLAQSKKGSLAAIFSQINTDEHDIMVDSDQESSDITGELDKVVAAILRRIVTEEQEKELLDKIEVKGTDAKQTSIQLILIDLGRLLGENPTDDPQEPLSQFFENLRISLPREPAASSCLTLGY
jgi:hypothetical protein